MAGLRMRLRYGAAGLLLVAVPVFSAPRVDPSEYHAALTLYGQGRAEEGLRRLARLEQPLFEVRTARPTDLYAQAFSRALKGYRDRPGMRGSVAAIVLHLHQGIERWNSLQSLRGECSVQFALEVLGKVESDSDPGSRKLRALSFKALAFSLQTSQEADQAIEFFAEALALDPNDPDALLGAGSVQERYGRYQLAVDLFQRLLQQAPAHEEGRLRLGLCQLRLGDVRAGLALLAQLRAEARTLLPAYLCRLELAQYYIRHERWTDARKLLQEAEQLAPDRSEAYLLDAYTLERIGERDQGLIRVLDSIAIKPDPTPSLRWLYDRTQAYKSKVYLERLRIFAGLVGGDG